MNIDEAVAQIALSRPGLAGIGLEAIHSATKKFEVGPCPKGSINCITQSAPRLAQRISKVDVQIGPEIGSSCVFLLSKVSERSSTYDFQA